jgi:dihydroorotate dehydrogenase
MEPGVPISCADSALQSQSEITIAASNAIAVAVRSIRSSIVPPPMPDCYALIRPLLWRLPAEAAHRLTIALLRLGAGRLLADRASTAAAPPLLQQQLWGLDFANPIGLAAGFDKEGEVADAMLGLGFGFVEVGTVTPCPQPGNPKPRLFRLGEDEAAINRMGFNSGGLDRVLALLARRKHRGIVGVNLGANRQSVDRAADYAAGIRRAAAVADYLVVNVSSPNTPGLRDLQRRAELERLLGRLRSARDDATKTPPLLLKIAPDLTPAECRDIAEVALAAGIDGMIIANTTLARPAELKSRHALEPGGLSGRPLYAGSTALLADMYRLTQGRLPLIGAGGVSSATDAYGKIRAGASLVQLYTALVFRGPALVGEIAAGLAELLERDCFSSIVQAIGSAAR